MDIEDGIVTATGLPFTLTSTNIAGSDDTDGFSLVYNQVIHFKSFDCFQKDPGDHCFIWNFSSHVEHLINSLHQWLHNGNEYDGTNVKLNHTFYCILIIVTREIKYLCIFKTVRHKNWCLGQIVLWYSDNLLTL